jgi:hypothetical protein
MMIAMIPKQGVPTILATHDEITFLLEFFGSK